MPLIHKADFWRVESRWHGVYDSREAFEAFTGVRIDDVSGTHWTYFDVTDESARKIQLLLGPHYRAIIKAYEARGN